MPTVKSKNTILKSKIRKEIKRKLNKQNEAQRLRKSRLVKDKLFRLSEFKKAKCIMFYLAKDKEVETRFMIREALKLGKRIALPTILLEKKAMIASFIKDLNSQLCLGPYGIMQPKKENIRPVPKKSIDLIIVPGQAFDRQGHRLGRGRGYYDTFLAKLNPRPACIGLAFDSQLLKDLPVFSHDISVTKVISA